jgi:uncharacterized membrane protein
MLADPWPTSSTTATTTPEAELAQQIVLAAYARERSRRRQALPRWLRLALRALPQVLGIVTVGNGLIGLLAVATPFLRVLLGATATAPLYSAYALICPQRPSHTWYLAGQPMAMEQRMVAMYLAFAGAGALYLWGTRLRRPLPTWIMLLAVAPVLVDVAISTVGIRHSTPMSRLWTGTLSAVAIVWWAYPRFDAQLAAVQRHVARLRGQEGTQPATGDDPDPATAVLESR